MKILAVVESKHKGNTLKIAKAMAEAAPVTITDIENAPKYNFRDYGIVGFGSGIYYGKHDKKLLEFVGKFCDTKAYAFVFSTSGSDSVEKNNRALVDLLKSKNKVVLGIVVLSFVLSYLSGVLPGISQVASGTRTIILTVAISAVAALLFPRPEDEEVARES